jgi:phenylpropionate dioxygenase-like ring-hydroxylating dioxygenase large terminal subunit
MSLQDYWYIACENRELKEKPLARTLFDQHLALYRDDAGKPAALLDRCAHRNMALSLGKVVGGCLECPYHGWRYVAAGHCEAVPSLGPGATIPSSIRIPSFRCVEQDGYVWVHCSDKEPTALPFSFPHATDPEWTTFRMKTRFAASVESCLENFLDCPHTVFVHKGWFRNPDARSLTALVRRLPDSVEVEFKNEPTSDSVIARLLYPNGQPLKHTDRFLMPNLSRVDYDFGPKHHFIITSQCTPISEIETEVYNGDDLPLRPVGELDPALLRANEPPHYQTGCRYPCRANQAAKAFRRSQVLPRRDRSPGPAYPIHAPPGRPGRS